VCSSLGQSSSREAAKDAPQSHPLCRAPGPEVSAVPVGVVVCVGTAAADEPLVENKAAVGSAAAAAVKIIAVGKVCPEADS